MVEFARLTQPPFMKMLGVDRGVFDAVEAVSPSTRWICRYVGDQDVTRYTEFQERLLTQVRDNLDPRIVGWEGMNEAIEAECPGIRDLNVFFQTGGNTLGASHYLAKAVLGANPLIFVGADLSFSHDRKFHPFDSPYDKQFAGVVPCTDVFGYRVATWPSYFGFKTWFEHMALGGLGNRPGTYINATEGGILGAYPEGNMMQIPQRRLAEVITEYTMHDVMPKIVADKTKIMSLY